MRCHLGVGLDLGPEECLQLLDMTSKSRHVLLLFIITILGRPAVALDLKEALQTAHATNPRLQELDAEVDAASAVRLRAWSAHMPHITASGRHLFDNKFQFLTVSLGGSPPFDFPFVQPYTDLSLTASMLLFDGLLSWRRIQAASSNADAAEANRERERFKLEQDVRMKFYQSLGAKTLAEVARANVSTLEQHLSDVKVETKTGVATKFDLLRVEVQLEDAKTDLLAADDKVAIAEEQLRRTLGVDKLAGSVSGKLPVPPESALRTPALDPNNRRDRAAEILHTEAAEELGAATWGGLLPQISVYGSQDWYDNVTREIGADSHFRDAYEIGVTMMWNLFDGGAQIANFRQAHAEAAKARAQLREVELAIPVDFDMWKRRLSHSLAVYQAAGKNVEKAEESVRLSRSGVRAGVRTHTEMLDAERDLNQARAKVVQAQLDALEALANLELALGKPYALPAMD